MQPETSPAPDHSPAASRSAASGAQRRIVQRMHPEDNVATALVELAPGMVIRVPATPAPSGAPAEETEIVVRSTVPFGHKVALTDVAPGEPVRKYGEVIGLASMPIRVGEHVHTHNVDSQRGRGDLSR